MKDSVEDCVFCRIAAGLEDAAVIYEDDQLIAFLDIAPLSAGHSLLVPKDHYPSIVTMPPELQETMMTTATRIAVGVMKAVKADGFNLLLSNGTCAGQLVRHAYINIIPRVPLDSLILPPPGGADSCLETTRKLVKKIQKKLHKSSSE